MNIQLVLVLIVFIVAVAVMGRKIFRVFSKKKSTGCPGCESHSSMEH